MMGLSVGHWIVVVVIALMLFGSRNKISEIMGDVARGIKAFHRGIIE